MLYSSSNCFYYVKVLEVILKTVKEERARYFLGYLCLLLLPYRIADVSTGRTRIMTILLQSLTASKTAGHGPDPFQRTFKKHHDELLLPLDLSHITGRVVVLCWTAFVCVRVCAVCAVGVSRPDNGPDGKMLPARSRWRRPPATIFSIVFLFV
jgi:hypothetical protein